MKSCILCRYSEIALKGKNRFIFEDRLVSNIDDCLKRNKILADIKKLRGRIIIYTEDHSATTHLKRVFGLSSVSPAFEIASDFDTILAVADEYTEKNLPDNTKTFRISSNRVDKRFPIHSNEMDNKVGYLIGDKYDLKANLKHPEYDLHIEIHKETFIYHEKIQCLGGLPVGVSGNIACLITCPGDLVAPWLLMKRGCSPFLIIENNTDASILSFYDYGSPVHADKTVKDINAFISDNSCKALAVADTLDLFDPERYKEIDYVVLTPLIGYSVEEVAEIFNRIKNV